MPVYSMTGYASAQNAASGTGASAEETAAHAPRPHRLGLEIRSVNSRFLDISFRLPDELRALEPALRSLLTARLRRGKVELRAALGNEGSSPLQDPPAKLLQRLSFLQDCVRAWLPDAAPLTVADTLRLCATAQAGAEDWSAAVPALAEQALDALLSAREREGTRLAAMLLERVRQLRALARQAVPMLPSLVEQQRQRFLERWQEAMALTGDAVLSETARERALADATAYALRIDVAEEITRLDSHLDETERLLKKGGEVGKRLDFLIQELHREANTLGAKSAALELTRVSLDMKVLIEQMREQVQNIE
ncbi:YicC/YloC family endoribonuclease [Verminephrobacter aporrectodeae]|uniref:YicC/YloC family endoribonuclease n=1 Tax=Verminephrobacter aporrectodeae TaxID=1110389 RepID=UPI002242FFF2|nr:YicC/YloC family endoribonuclease [Verminephrobacter aporrectodeae]MCW8176540.1 YicC family protein [Verminephrobacter aporrectodeae subsp. tuberculatae]MCW8204193.1 YicC family protein [Verminephrobacter aporrectodeae subsp. tuberculatae]